MSDSINRRKFIKQGIVLGASIIFANNTFGLLDNLAHAATPSELAAVTGSDYYKNTIEAVNLLGGIQKYVPKNSTVGLLINSSIRHPGSFVKPEITLAVIHMCLEAGAKEIGMIKRLEPSYWKTGGKTHQAGDEVQELRNMSGNYREVAIPGGKSLKSAEVAIDLLDCDVFFNISIAKNHTGTSFTGTMKNMMGATSSSTNSFFHFGSGNRGGYYDDIEFLSQCIADVNLVRKPELCFLDGTEILTTNGPAGPGKIARPETVMASTDRVALDSYGATLLGLRPDDIVMIKTAHEHGIGEINLSKIRLYKQSV
jgi:uncharacterized protein (DUF362 family)